MIIPEIKKILYATDLSANARYSFGYAASLAHRYGAGITIIHVLDDLKCGIDTRSLGNGFHRLILPLICNCFSYPPHGGGLDRTAVICPLWQPPPVELSSG